MGVLRACRQLYDEVFPIIYNKEVLCFKVAPRYQYRSWISVSSRCGAAWTLESSEDALSHGYNKLPYSKLRAVRIEVEAPNPLDPGQLICVWKKVRELVELLGQAGQLPDLEINLLKSSRASWMGFGRPQQSIAGDVSDWALVLITFCYLRGVPSVKINFPEEFDCETDDRISRIPAIVPKLMASGKPGWTYPNKECRNCNHERAVRYLLDEVFYHLDTALDFVPGLTANMMRLARFSSWYDNEIYGKSKYLDELERIYKNAEGRTGNPWDIAGLKWRYRLMAALNPLSAKMQNMLFQLGENVPNPYNLGQEYPSCNSWRMRDWKRYICRKNFYDKLKNLGIGLLNESHTQTRIDDLSINDGWDPAEWHRLYPDGIPPLGRHLFIFEFEMGKWDDQEFMEAPRSRFTGWDGAKYNWQASYEMPMHEAMAWLRLENE